MTEACTPSMLMPFAALEWITLSSIVRPDCSPSPPTLESPFVWIPFAPLPWKRFPRTIVLSEPALARYRPWPFEPDDVLPSMSESAACDA
jgi:hypothetical protein